MTDISPTTTPPTAEAMREKAAILCEKSQDCSAFAIAARIRAIPIPAPQPLSVVEPSRALIERCAKAFRAVEADANSRAVDADPWYPGNSGPGQEAAKYRELAEACEAALTPADGGDVLGEREACAKVADEKRISRTLNDFDAGYNVACDSIASAIRARGGGG